MIQRLLLFLILCCGTMASHCPSTGGYIVREYPDWYQVIHEADAGSGAKGFSHTPSLWIERPTGKVIETVGTMSTKEIVRENRVDAILGIVNINRSLYLNVVTLSEPVANVSLDEATAEDCETSPIFSVKMTKMLPLEPEVDYGKEYPLHITSAEGSHRSTPKRSNSPRQGNGISSQNSKDRFSGGGAIMDQNIGIINDINQLLSSGHYYSCAADLTQPLQRQWEKGLLPLKPRRVNLEEPPFDHGPLEGTAENSSSKNGKTLFEMADPYFNWSRGMIHGIPSHWITVIIQGYVGYSLQNWNNKRVEIMLIARRSTHRYGTRLNARGIDENGNVGNFVESELRLRVDGSPWKSFVQIRGSVPVFWGQKNIFSPAYFTRPLHESEVAFRLHYDFLEKTYGKDSEIFFMSLLDTKASEIALTQGMEHIDHTFPDMKLRMVRYNYNEKVKWSTMVPELLTFVNLQLMGTMQRIGYFDGSVMKKPLQEVLKHKLNDGRIEGTQRGVIRTNCLDCLDRTNAMQMMIAWVWLAGMLDPDGMTTILDPENETHFTGSLRQFRDMWCALGDSISFQHAGTPSIYSQHIREGKQSYIAMFHYTKTMVTRACSTVFNDEARQTCMDILMNSQLIGSPKIKHAPEAEVTVESISLPSDAPSSELVIWCGTWNMNGAALSNKDDMYDWISTGTKHNAEIYVFFLQEFVELSVLNVLSGKTEENKEVLFNGKVARILGSLHENKEMKFHHIKSSSMLGLYITVFVSDRLKGSVRNLTTTSVKTGFSGSVGNKGAVGMKFEVGGNQIAFIDVHLNFGKLQTRIRVQELDYVMKHVFSENGPRSLYEQDLFVMGGDFNFQIASKDETDDMDIMEELYKGRIDNLLKADEFLSDVKYGPPHMSNLQEAPIMFEPTYKFKPGNNYYHLKRPPAWCDRILYGGYSVINKENRIKCLSYMRHDDMLSSDHKAVSAVFHLLSAKKDKKQEPLIQPEPDKEPPPLIDL